MYYSKCKNQVNIIELVSSVVSQKNIINKFISTSFDFKMEMNKQAILFLKPCLLYKCLTNLSWILQSLPTNRRWPVCVS